jgi:hypothetical protein
MVQNVPHGTVDLYFMRRGPFFAKQVYALRPGRSIELSLYQACDSTDAARAAKDALDTVDMAMHELTHLIDALYLRQENRADDREHFADEAPSCVYEELAKLQGGDELAQRYPAHRNYEESGYYKNDSPAFDMHELCGNWASSIATLSR